MKRTIKEERETEIIKEEFLDENSLLQYKKDNNNNFEVVIKYITKNQIHEQFLARIENSNPNKTLLQLNEDSTAIAIFKKYDNAYQLKRLYKVRTHSFAHSEFLDIVYPNFFSKTKLDSHLQLVKKISKN